jgi:hypothetical protein
MPGPPGVVQDAPAATALKRIEIGEVSGVIVNGVSLDTLPEQGEVELPEAQVYLEPVQKVGMRLPIKTGHWRYQPVVVGIPVVEFTRAVCAIPFTYTVALVYPGKRGALAASAFRLKDALHAVPVEGRKGMSRLAPGAGGVLNPSPGTKDSGNPSTFSTSLR